MPLTYHWLLTLCLCEWVLSLASHPSTCSGDLKYEGPVWSFKALVHCQLDLPLAADTICLCEWVHSLASHPSLLQSGMESGNVRPMGTQGIPWGRVRCCLPWYGMAGHSMIMLYALQFASWYCHTQYCHCNWWNLETWDLWGRRGYLELE